MSTAEKMGDLIACREDALAILEHLKKIEASKKIEPGFWSYKEGTQERWIAITTAEEIDSDGDTFDTEGQDFAIRYAKESGDYPELRVFHVRGLKAGKCDSMARYGKWAVDQGYYDDTQFAKETKRVVDAGGLPHMSRGFSVLEATGLCPQCGTGLRVQAHGLKIGFKCPVCDGIFSGRALKEKRFTKVHVFDLTVTDRPAVRSTAIASYTMKENTMTREELKERLVERGFSEEVVSAWLDSLADEDLLRMKEEDQALKEFSAAVELATKEAEEEDEEGMVEMKGDTVTCYKCGATMRVRNAQEQKEIEIDTDALMTPLMELITTQVKEAIPSEIEVELPELSARLDALEGAITEIKEAVLALGQTEEDRLKEMLKDAPSAMVTRLRLRQKEKPQETKEENEQPKSGSRIRTGQGEVVTSMSEAMGLHPPG